MSPAHRFLFLPHLLVLSSLPAYPQARPVQVNVSDLSPVETTVAINPADRDNIVGAALTTKRAGREGGMGNLSFSSRDGGRSWAEKATPNEAHRVQGDDAVCFDADGRVYHSFLSFRGLHSPTGKGYNSIEVCRSDDGGATWRNPVTVIGTGDGSSPFDDKPSIACDRTSGSRRNTLYIAWTRFTKYASRLATDSSFIMFSRSTDRGATFSDPVRISDQAGDAADGDSTVEGAVPAIGPDGEVYISWGSKDGLVFSKSTDGGNHFSRNRVITQTPGGWSFDVSGLQRSNGMPVTACDVSNGPYRGRIYVNWVDNRNARGAADDHDVFVVSSDDAGSTWSAPVRVNDDSAGSSREQFFTWMSVDPLDGSVNIAFFDRRRHAGDTTEVILARSTDGGKTFLNSFVGEPFVPVRSHFFGDYIGISASRKRVAILYPAFSGTGINVYAIIRDF